MKRKLPFITLALLAFSLVACDKGENNNTGGNTSGGTSQDGGNTQGGGDQQENDPLPTLTLINCSYNYFVQKNTTVEYKMLLEAQVSYEVVRVEGTAKLTQYNVDGTEYASAISFSTLGSKRATIQSPTKKYIKLTWEASAYFKFYVDNGTSIDKITHETASDPFSDVNALQMDNATTVNNGTARSFKYLLQKNYAYEMRQTSLSSDSCKITIEDKDGNIMNQIDNLVWYKSSLNWLSVNAPETKWVKITIDHTTGTGDTTFIFESAFVRVNI